MQIKGELKSENGKLLVRGRIVSNKLFLTILIGYTILFFGMLIHSLISAQIEKSIVTAIGMCLLIGVGNLIKLKKAFRTKKLISLAD